MLPLGSPMMYCWCTNRKHIVIKTFVAFVNNSELTDTNFCHVVHRSIIIIEQRISHAALPFNDCSCKASNVRHIKRSQAELNSSQKRLRGPEETSTSSTAWPCDGHRNKFIFKTRSNIHSPHCSHRFFRRPFYWSVPFFHETKHSAGVQEMFHPQSKEHLSILHKKREIHSWHPGTIWNCRG